MKKNRNKKIETRSWYYAGSPIALRKSVFVLFRRCQVINQTWFCFAERETGFSFLLFSSPLFEDSAFLCSVDRLFTSYHVRWLSAFNRDSTSVKSSLNIALDKWLQWIFSGRNVELSYVRRAFFYPQTR